jgi:hypothetical protein
VLIFRQQPPAPAGLRLVFLPSLLAALALEHANSATLSGIQHGSDKGRLLAAMAARPDQGGLDAQKGPVLKLAAHGDSHTECRSSGSYKLIFDR